MKPRKGLSQTTNASSGQRERALRVIAPIIIALAALAAYSDSFHGPFVFDDLTAIAENEALHSFRPLAIIFARPHAMRPVVDLTLAANWELGGADAFGYHVVNLVIHVLAGLALYGVVRRTLCAPRLAGTSPARHADALALAAALLWTLHPLQTESVTYIIQRAESMMGMFYLLTLYCAIRGFGATSGEGRMGGGEDGRTPDTRAARLSSPPPVLASSRRYVWHVLAIAACVLGMGCKQVMVTAPLLILLYDRTFFADTFRQALRRSPGLYAGLAASWLVLAALVATASAGPTAGFGMTFYTPLRYATLQIGVVAHYFRLAVWPSPLCLDYEKAPETWALGIPAAVIASMLAAMVWAVIRRPAWGFLGAWAFVILAPTSSVMPIKDLAFEHRMYLSLAGVVVLAVVGAYAAAAQWLPDPTRRRAGLTALAAACVILAVALGWRTYLRNKDYHDAVAVWQDVVSKMPDNVRALNNLGNELGKRYMGGGRKPTPEQIEQVRKPLARALAIDPEYWLALNNMGNLLMAEGKFDEAAGQFRMAVAANGQFTTAWMNLGAALENMGRDEEALKAFQKAVDIDPRNARFLYELAGQLKKMQRHGEALRRYQEALRRTEEARGADRVSAAASIHRGMADTYERIGDGRRAAEHFRTALALKPGDTLSLTGLAWVLATCEDETVRNGPEARQLAEQACRAWRKPAGKEAAKALDALATAQAQQTQFSLAVQTARQAREVALEAGQNDLASEIAGRIKLYEALKPFRQTTSRPSGS
ncbi:MAG: tetratricopeptide repeat protein [Phycisphaerae bacterium]